MPIFQGFIHGSVFSKQRLILSELFIYERFVLVVSRGRQVIARVVRQHKRKTRLSYVFLVFIISSRCPFRPPPRFDDKYSAFPLNNCWSLMNPSLVGYPLIFGRIYVRKSERNPSTLVVAPVMTSCTLVGIYDGFFLWYNLYNLLKR